MAKFLNFVLLLILMSATASTCSNNDIGISTTPCYWYPQTIGVNVDLTLPFGEYDCVVNYYNLYDDITPLNNILPFNSFSDALSYNTKLTCTTAATNLACNQDEEKIVSTNDTFNFIYGNDNLFLDFLDSPEGSTSLTLSLVYEEIHDFVYNTKGRVVWKQFYPDAKDEITFNEVGKWLPTTDSRTYIYYKGSMTIIH